MSSVNISSAPSPPPSVAAERAFIEGDINEYLALLYVLGIYSGVYAGTTYIYLYKGNVSVFHKALVIGTLTASYIVLTASGLMQLYTFFTRFRMGGYSKASLFNGLTSSETLYKISFAMDILEYTSFILSDGLMLWRCFHACGRSRVQFTLPLGFFIIELGLIIANVSLIITGYLNDTLKTSQTATQRTIIFAAIFGAVGATSITSTFMICRTIYANTTNDGQSRVRFKYIADILIQSSAIYSTLMFLSSIFVILILRTQTTNVQISENIIVTMAIGMTGFVPTLMVARLAMGTEQQNTECFSLSLPQFGDRNSFDEEQSSIAHVKSIVGPSCDEMKAV